ncbi:delta-aminolevulinic acid dehydratase [Bacillus safensis]|uniref:delta-aminolevulinic acid dehydratase n=1 Tax=Bacillus safensis TaxID=561879 RepID=UPI00226F2E71|nr:delta-aminolevulinic acid dehydratase [Bacillus safensis]MCY1118948.1 delta-aminolevulinic acid dehydratase [Bacillus safensis]
MDQQAMRITLAAGPNSELESFALRAALENFGAKVDMHWIGRPNDLIHVLSGRNRGEIDYLLLSFHGEEGALIMPELGEDVYEDEEPRDTAFGAGEIKRYASLEGVHVISTGCTLGEKNLADAFLKAGATSYTAPDDYIDGNAAFIFLLTMLYELMNNTKTVRAAFDRARSIDEETKLFQLYMQK